MDGNTNVTAGGATGAENGTEAGNQQGQNTANQQTQSNIDGQQTQTGTETPKTYTAEELQAETDRRVTEAVKTANAKSEETFKKQLEEARAQWEKEAKMSAEEREKAAAEKAKSDFEKEKAEFAHEKLVSYAGIQLVKNSLPEEIAELITASDATEDAIGEGIGKLKAFFDKAVEAAVNEKLKGKSPDTGGGDSSADPFLNGFGI